MCPRDRTQVMLPLLQRGGNDVKRTLCCVLGCAGDVPKEIETAPARAGKKNLPLTIVYSGRQFPLRSGAFSLSICLGGVLFLLLISCSFSLVSFY